MPTIYLRPNPEQKARLAALSKATKAGPGPWKSENTLMLELLDAHLAKLDGKSGSDVSPDRQEAMPVDDQAELGEPGALDTAKITVRLAGFMKRRVEKRAKAVGMGVADGVLAKTRLSFPSVAASVVGDLAHLSLWGVALLSMGTGVYHRGGVLFWATVFDRGAFMGQHYAGF